MAKDFSAERAIAARMHKMRCYYCNVPTAATIDHVRPRAEEGRSWMNNLVLACPYCNTRKSKRDVEEFIASGDWRLERPADLPPTMAAMLAEHFGIENAGEGKQEVRTGSAHARLELQEGKAALLVRPGSKYPWTRFELGPADRPEVIAGAWDFLRRHHTPKEPKQIPGRYWAEKKLGRR